MMIPYIESPYSFLAKCTTSLLLPSATTKPVQKLRPGSRTAWAGHPKWALPVAYEMPAPPPPHAASSPPLPSSSPCRRSPPALPVTTRSMYISNEHDRYTYMAGRVDPFLMCGCIDVSGRVLQVQMTNVTRLCVTKSIPTVNGQFPGPKLVVREGDRLVVKVHNHMNYNVSFHW